MPTTYLHPLGVKINTERTIARYLDPLINDLRQTYIRLGLFAYGIWLEELSWDYDVTTEHINIKLNTADYTDYITPPGRKPGPVSYQTIFDWVNIKQGVPPDGFTPEQFAWIVVHKLNTEGIDVPNPFNEGTLTDPILEFIDKQLLAMINDITLIYLEAYLDTTLAEFNKSPNFVIR